MSGVGAVTGTNQQLLPTLDPAAQDKLAAALQGSFSPEETSKILGALTQVVGGMKGSLVDGKTAPNGAPALDLPGMEFSSDEMMIALQGMNQKVTEGQMQTAKGQIELSRGQRKVANEEALKKLQEAAEKSKQAAEAGIFQKIFNWIKSVVMAIVAVVAVAVAVVACPMLLPLALQMASSAIVDLVNLVRAEQGMPPIEFKGLFNEMLFAIGKAMGMDDKAARAFGDVATAVLLTVTSMGISALVTPDIYGKGLESVLIAAGVPEDKAKIAGMVLSMVVQVASIIAVTVITAGAATGPAVAAMMGKTAKIVMAAVSIAQGAVQIASGATNIAVSVYQNQAETARIDAKEIQKVTAKLMAAMEENMDQIKELMKQLDEGNQLISQMLASSAQTRGQQIRNIV